MVHAYHVIFGAYGFWLPNDPRGSWSDFVGKWELVRFGRATKSLERAELTPDEERQRRRAKQTLKYPAVQFTGAQAKAIGQSFAELYRKRNYTLCACSILPEHTHLVIARHTYPVESIVNLLKGEATRKLVADGLHPLARYAKPGERPPKMWAQRLWKVYLDTSEAIEAAIRYVEDNPEKEGKPAQTWHCVTPYRGLDAGWTTYH